MAEEWIPIDEAPVGVKGLVWQRAWRCPFPGMRIDDDGVVWIDTCELHAQGRMDHADWWKPFGTLPESITDDIFLAKRNEVGRVA